MISILRWVFYSILKIVLLVSVPLASIAIPLFYKRQTEDLDNYTWGGWWGTFDNPPQGDRGYVSKRSLFPNITTGFKGYVNRVVWMLRNPLYGFSKKAGIAYSASDTLLIKGNSSISDKYKVAGWMFATLRDERDTLKAFEWYSVTPYTRNRNVRIRLGWKIKTDKMQERGWARHVFTINPFDGYGNR